MSKKFQQDAPPLVPAYLVTFSDMVTLLLTFFVLLLSLADKQSPEILGEGRKAFADHISTFGLGVLTGKKVSAELGHVKNKYGISKPDEDAAIRTIDAKKEERKRMFQKVAKSMKTLPSKIVARNTTFTTASITFKPGQKTLDADAKKFLTQFATNLQQNSNGGNLKLYVLGMANQESDSKDQWILSALRADAVANFLSETIPSTLQWPVYSWGAGPGGVWLTNSGPITEQSQIMIAVLRTE